MLLMIAACDGDPVGLTPAQQVYEVVMNERLQDPLREVILLDETQAPYLVDKDVESVQTVARLSGDVPDALMQSLIASAQTHRPLDWQPVMVNARLVSRDQIGSVESVGDPWRSREFWENFRSRFPEHSEFYALSSVAFNDDYSEAALVVSYYCSAMCGSGEFLVYLEKDGMAWKRIGSSFFWTT